MNCNFRTVTQNFEKHMYILCNLKDPDPYFYFESDPDPYKSDPDLYKSDPDPKH